MRARDETAIVDLDAAYRSRIQQLALRYVKTLEDAEEVAQDVLLKVYLKIDAFRGDAALSSWIYRITFNTVMSRLRGQRMTQLHEVRELDLLADVEENGGGIRREPADWSSLATRPSCARSCGRVSVGVEGPAGDLPDARHPSGSSRPDDRRGEHEARHQGADAEVKAPPRPAVPAGAPQRVRHRLSLHRQVTSTASRREDGDRFSFPLPHEEMGPVTVCVTV